MPLSVYKTSLSAWKTAKGLSVYKTSLSAWQPAKGAWVYKTSLGAWEQVYTSVTISGISSTVSTTNTAVGFSTNAAHAVYIPAYTISGGTGPYSQTITKVSGSTHTLVGTAGPNDPSSAQVSAGSDGTTGISGVFRLDVTDSLGATGSYTVTINFN